MGKSIKLALGANLPCANGRSPIDTCWWALQQLQSLGELRLHRLSHWYLTRPVPASDQPDYVNAVASFLGKCDAARILNQLHLIENYAGRVRTAINASRVLDLDLLAVDDECCDRPDLVLPHPRLHQRAFVLYPLCDVDPDWRHPRLGQTAAQLRERVADQAIQRIAERTRPGTQGLPSLPRVIT